MTSAFFLFWFFGCLLVTFGIFRLVLLTCSQGYTTSLSYMLEHGGIAATLIRKTGLPLRFAPFLFMLFQLVFTVLTFLPLTLLWSSFWYGFLFQ